MTRELFAGRSDWRAPSGKEMACEVCKAAAPCGMGGRFYCLRCVPASFWPAPRVEPQDGEDVV